MKKTHWTSIHDGLLILGSLLMRIEGSICTFALLFGGKENPHWSLILLNGGIALLLFRSNTHTITPCYLNSNTGLFFDPHSFRGNSDYTYYQLGSWLWWLPMPSIDWEYVWGKPKEILLLFLFSNTCKRSKYTTTGPYRHQGWTITNHKIRQCFQEKLCSHGQ